MLLVTKVVYRVTFSKEKMSKLLIDIHYRLCSSQEDQALAILDQIIGQEDDYTTEDENVIDTGNTICQKK